MRTKKVPNCACQHHDGATIYRATLIMKTIQIMKLFTGLKKIREFERAQLPFLRTVVDFDIVIEIGYAEEQGKPLTLKQLFLLDVSSRTTVRRKLAKLDERGIIIRRK